MTHLNFRFFVLASLMMSAMTARGDYQSLLQEGVNSYQAGKFDQARENFAKLRSENAWNFTALYNLGNTAARQKKMGEAIGFYRLALQKKPLDPDTRSNLLFAMNSLGIKQFPGARGNFELFRAEILNSATTNQLLAALAVVLFFFFFNLYKFLKIRKIDSFEDKPIPTQPPFVFFIWSALFLFLAVTSVAKILDGYSERATVIAAKADLKSGPGEANATLVELSEGSEVQVQDESNSWKQVTALDGERTGLTGWVKQESLMVTAGGGPW
jgi:tetratricopeptide (TPR) repeat protein